MCGHFEFYLKYYVGHYISWDCVMKLSVIEFVYILSLFCLAVIVDEFGSLSCYGTVNAATRIYGELKIIGGSTIIPKDFWWNTKNL